MANESVRDKLYADFAAAHVEIVDNSWMHAGHAGMADNPYAEGTHLQILVVSPQFEGVSRLDRHRLVHTALKEAFETHLHALELKAMTPDEWKSKVS